MQLLAQGVRSGAVCAVSLASYSRRMKLQQSFGISRERAYTGRPSGSGSEAESRGTEAKFASRRGGRIQCHAEGRDDADAAAGDGWHQRGPVGSEGGMLRGLREPGLAVEQHRRADHEPTPTSKADATGNVIKISYYTYM